MPPNLVRSTGGPWFTGAGAWRNSGCSNSSPSPARWPDAGEGDESRGLHDECVLEGATVPGLHDDELAAVLRGRPPAEVDIPQPGKASNACAERPR